MSGKGVHANSRSMKGHKRRRKSRMLFLTIHTTGGSRTPGTLPSSKAPSWGEHLKQLFPTTYSPETGAGRKFSCENKIDQSPHNWLASLYLTSFVVLLSSWVFSCHNSDDAPRMILYIENENSSPRSSDAFMDGQALRGGFSISRATYSFYTAFP